MGGSVVGRKSMMVVSTAEATMSGELGGMREWEVFKKSLEFFL